MSLFTRFVQAMRPTNSATRRGRPCKRQPSKSIANIDVATGDICVVECGTKNKRAQIRVVREATLCPPRSKSAPPDSRVVSVEAVYASVHKQRANEEDVYSEVADALPTPSPEDPIYSEIMLAGDDAPLPFLKTSAYTHRMNIDTRKRVKLASRRMNLSTLSRGRGDPSPSRPPVVTCPYAIVDLETCEVEDIIVTRFVRSSSASPSRGPPPSTSAPPPPLPLKAGRRTPPQKPPRRALMARKAAEAAAAAAAVGRLPPLPPKTTKQLRRVPSTVSEECEATATLVRSTEVRRSLRGLCPGTPSTRKRTIYV